MSDEPDKPSGEHRRTPTGEQPVLKRQFRATKWLTRGNAAGLLALLATIGISTDKVKGWLVRDAVAQDAGVAQLKEQQATLKTDFKEHLADEAQAKRQQAQTNYEVQLGMQDLYKAVMYGERSRRLEAVIPPPALDGGR